MTETAVQGSSAVRQFNERAILTALRRRGEASKADLARDVNLTANAAGQIVEGLARHHLIQAKGKRTGLRGQPATLLRLNPAGAYAIGVKIGRRSQDSLVIDFSGAVLASRSHERPLPTPHKALRLVQEDIEALTAALPPAARGRLAGVGLAIPYNLGSWRRELGLPVDVCADWNAFDLAGQLRACTTLPVLAENDGTAVAVAELFNGHGRELDDFAAVFVGGAVGGGLVLGGQYRRGAAGNAADIGLLAVPPSRLPSAPPLAGATEILLARASVNALERHLRHAGATVGTAAELEAAFDSHPGAVAEWLEDCADALAAPLQSIGSLLDLQAIVVDGNLPRELLRRLVARLRVLLIERAPESCVPPVLRVGTAGRKAAAVGAATLPLHSNYGLRHDALPAARRTHAAVGHHAHR